MQKLFGGANRGKPLTARTIVLDLDNTLICTQDEMDDYKNLKIGTDPKLTSLRSRVYRLSASDVVSKRGSGENFLFWGTMRPGCRKFLDFCFRYFRYVVVWSAGKKRYVEALVDYLFKDTFKPDLILTHDDCVRAYDGDSAILEKPLTKVMKLLGAKEVKESNILVLDDNPTTFSGPNPDNALYIPMYEPKPEIEELEDESDQALAQAERWLLLPEVIKSPDVRQLDKSEIF